MAPHRAGTRTGQTDHRIGKRYRDRQRLGRADRFSRAEATILIGTPRCHRASVEQGMTEMVAHRDWCHPSFRQHPARHRNGTAEAAATCWPANALAGLVGRVDGCWLPRAPGLACGRRSTPGKDRAIRRNRAKLPLTAGDRDDALTGQRPVHANADRGIPRQTREIPVIPVARRPVALSPPAKQDAIDPPDETGDATRSDVHDNLARKGTAQGAPAGGGKKWPPPLVSSSPLALPPQLKTVPSEHSAGCFDPTPEITTGTRSSYEWAVKWTPICPSTLHA